MFKRRMARAIPPLRRLIDRHDALLAERDRLAEEVRLLRSGAPLPGEGSFRRWIWDQVAAEPYWFHTIELPGVRRTRPVAVVGWRACYSSRCCG